MTSSFAIIDHSTKPQSPGATSEEGQWASPKKKIKLTHADADTCEAIEKPHNHDVLCGRGGLVNTFPGNVVYRMVVETNKGLYRSASRMQKMLLAQSIVASISRQNPPGRFLSRDKKTGLWYDIGTDNAITKATQALREPERETEQSYKSIDDQSLDRCDSPLHNKNICEVHDETMSSDDFSEVSLHSSSHDSSEVPPPPPELALQVSDIILQTVLGDEVSVVSQDSPPSESEAEVTGMSLRTFDFTIEDLDTTFATEL